MQSTRRLFSALAPATLTAALLGCTALSQPGQPGTVQQILDVTNAVLNYGAPIAALVASFVPGATVWVPQVEKGLADAYAVANTIVSTMTVSAAQPLVQRISTDIKGAFDAAAQAIDAIPDKTTQARVRAILAQAAAGIPLLDAFVAGVALAVNPPTVAARMGAIPLPPLRIVMGRP